MSLCEEEEEPQRDRVSLNGQCVRVCVWLCVSLCEEVLSQRDRVLSEWSVCVNVCVCVCLCVCVCFIIGIYFCA